MSYSRFGTYNAVLPKGGPVTYPFPLDFSTQPQQTVDMQPEISAGKLDYISGCFVDNRTNAADLEIVCEGTNQKVRIPAGKQAYMPLLIGDAASLTINTTQANGLIVPFFVVNFPVWPIIF